MKNPVCPILQTFGYLYFKNPKLFLGSDKLKDNYHLTNKFLFYECSGRIIDYLIIFFLFHKETLEITENNLIL